MTLTTMMKRPNPNETTTTTTAPISNACICVCSALFTYNRFGKKKDMEKKENEREQLIENQFFPSWVAAYCLNAASIRPYFYFIKWKRNIDVKRLMCFDSRLRHTWAFEILISPEIITLLELKWNRKATKRKIFFFNFIIPVRIAMQRTKRCLFAARLRPI